MLTLKIKFPNVSRFPSRDIYEERERLGKAGWSQWYQRGISHRPSGMDEPEIDREIRALYLLHAHWNERFLGLEPKEISVVFQNSLFPMYLSDRRFLDTSNKWVDFASEMFPEFWYRVRTNVGEKTLEVRVFGGQQLGGENLKKFLLTLSSYHTATKIAREIHQFRMAAGKQNVPEMDRHHKEILETLGQHLPR